MTKAAIAWPAFPWRKRAAAGGLYLKVSQYMGGENARPIPPPLRKSRRVHMNHQIHS